ncbi:hypothetical protein DFH11DRAFT_440862 [Phellopilus nigrolimitatus]|nr:hypothetical protein DFH11DRAFT_440862 [Phellopilus nigrolimitatus]
MGVSGLWDILAPAGKSRSLAHLAVVDGFESNNSKRRAYRVGIDASIWYKHATYSKEGENPELRLLFFRVKELAKLPLLPLFVFDGRNRPKTKRGSKKGKTGSHNLSQDMKALLKVFGFEWREAGGEAEVELAHLNRAGIIDAVMTDDADTFLFGAYTIIRNPSMRLSSNKSHPALNLEGKESKFHVMEYRAEDIRTNPQIGMTQGGMVLFALLTGGDYDKGIDRFGKAVAHALARCGFGDELLNAVSLRESQSLHNFLPAWRSRINAELRENRRGFLKRLFPGLSVPNDFPSLDILNKYVEPAKRTENPPQMRATPELSLVQAASFCEKFFEWGTRILIVKRFRDLMWEACVIRILRRAALEQDKKEIERRCQSGMIDYHVRGARRPEHHEAVGTSISLIAKYLSQATGPVDRMERISEAFANQSRPPTISSRAPYDPRSFIIKIHSSRRHVSTDRIVEYRVEVDPSKFVELTRSGIQGKRPEKEEEGTTGYNGRDDDAEEDSDDAGVIIGGKKKRAKTAKPPADPLSTFRMWCPAPMLWRVNPRLVENYELGAEERNRKKERGGTGAKAPANSKGKGKRRAASSDREADTSADERGGSPRSSPPKKSRNTTQTSRRTENTAEVRTAPTQAEHTRVTERNHTQENAFSTVTAPSMPPVRGPYTNDKPASSMPPVKAPRPGPSRAFRPDPYPEDAPVFPSISALSSSCPPRTATNLSSVFQSGKRGASTSSSGQLRRTASSASRASGAGRDFNDGPSLFLFEIDDPCDPDLVEREDLRGNGNTKPGELTWSWTELSSDGERDGHGSGDEDDMELHDDKMDRLFERDFMRKAQEGKLRNGSQLKSNIANKSLLDKGKRKADNIDTIQTASATRPSDKPLRALASMPYVPLRADVRADQTAASQNSSAIPAPCTSWSSNADDHRPLFLPSPSPPRVQRGDASSQKSSQLMRLGSPSSDLIEIESSGEDETAFPSSSQNRPPSSGVPSSPDLLPSRGWSRRGYSSSRPSVCGSQSSAHDSGVVMFDDDVIIDLT